MRTLLLLLLSSLTALHAQTIQFANPNFEGTPNHSSLPKSWTDCGFPNESPPDTHPDYIFAVSTRAYAGKTYLGMVVRDNNTWEAVSGALSAPLVQGQCYQFQIALAASASYVSISRETQTNANYIAPPSSGYGAARVASGWNFWQNQNPSANNTNGSCTASRLDPARVVTAT